MPKKRRNIMRINKKQSREKEFSMIELSSYEKTLYVFKYNKDYLN